VSNHEKFHLKKLEDLEREIDRLSVDIPVSGSVENLSSSVAVGDLKIPNRLGVHPMEGCDGLPDGSPGPLTVRRYERFARGGAGLLWVEATAVVPEGRANPRQLWLHQGNLSSFSDMMERARRVQTDLMGANHDPFYVLQLTHSGRYSKPASGFEPIIAARNPYLDPKGHITDATPVITDDELEQLEDVYVAAARMAYDIGFHSVDIKACHRYLVCELLGAHTREGRYGGSFENRTRFLLNVVDKIHDRVPGLLVTPRMNGYDGIPYPYGWGIDQYDHRTPDLSEPIELLDLLKSRGVPMVNITIGNPYYNPHVGRPFDLPIDGGYTPDEHPLEGCARLFGVVRDLQKAHPDLPLVGTGFSWLRQFLGHVGAAMVDQGWLTMVGVGREAFAHPEFAYELLTHGNLDARAVCITCSRCTQIMRDEGRTGCVPRDHEVYSSIFLEGRRPDKGKPKKASRVAEHL